MTVAAIRPSATRDGQIPRPTEEGDSGRGRRRRGEDASADDADDEASTTRLDDDAVEDDADDDGDRRRRAVSRGGAATRERPRPRPAAAEDQARTDGRVGIFGRIARFVREVIAELRKVIWPTRKELLTYTAVVIVVRRGA